jgi:cytochrome c oxidase accessory protein FixG
MSTSTPDDRARIAAMLENPAAIDSSAADFRSVLASVDKDGRRRWLFVHVVPGLWRRRRQLLSVVLIGFYLAVPFVSIGGHPLLRLDIPERKFWILGMAFWPQDLSYFLLFVLLGIVATLLAVALLGRVFCGWLCPHNVFLEMVFRPVEAFFQGDAFSRARQARDGSGGARRLATWAAWILLSGALANTATAIFTGTDAFLWGLIVDPITHPAAAVFFAIFFSATLFNFSWFREQTCTIVCPYGRFQTVLLDPHSLVVGYDRQRGEPRGKVGGTTGDCIDCKLCVAVCPTGIDIRNGNQLECIHCTACVDACDTVMSKLKRPLGLIRYASEVGLAGGKRRLIRPRTVIYAVAITLLLSLTTYRLATREDILANLLRPIGMPMLVEDDGRTWVRQGITISLVNRSNGDLILAAQLADEPEARIFLQRPEIDLPHDARIEITPTIDLPKDRFAGGQDLRRNLSFTDQTGKTTTLIITLRSP